jgi:hypothetical protein
MLALALVALWLLLAVVAGLLIGRGINVLRAVESAAHNSPSPAKLAADQVRDAALEGPPQMAPHVQRREHVYENSA